jgi:iron complex outermembrane receptor protein
VRWRQRWSSWAGTEATWFLRGTNLTDALAYQATTIGSLRGLVPLPGRALSAGVQLTF